MTLKANDPTLKSWVDVPKRSDFPIQNLPFGVFKTKYLSPVAGVAIGNHVLDLVYLHEQGFLDQLGLPQGIFNQKYLNDFYRWGEKKAAKYAIACRHCFGMITMNCDRIRRLVKLRLFPWPKCKCACLSGFPITPIFTAVRNTPPMWALCFAIQKMHFFPTGNIYR